MSEDLGLVGFLRERLEGDVGGEPPRFGEIMRAAAEAAAARAAARRMRLWGSSLVAASLAAMCAFAFVAFRGEAPSAESTVASVIDILSAADGVEPSCEGASVADMLLAWQDAPYESAVSGLVADN